MSHIDHEAPAARRARSWARIVLLARHWPIVPIVLLFVGLGVYYSVTVPIFEAPDEPQHYANVRRVLDGASVSEADAALLIWDADVAPQQPLYYAIGAALARDIDIDRSPSWISSSASTR